MQKQDAYQIVTDKIISLMEQSGTDWVKPWVGGSALPISVTTGKKYNGINRLLLGFAPYSDSRWGTYKAWQQKGAQVRKGEKGTLVVFWKWLDIKDKDSGEEKQIPLLRYYNVFNAQQCDGVEIETPDELPAIAERIAAAEHFVANTGANVVTGESAYYAPGPDSICMPHIDSFTGTQTSNATECYYSVLLHELTHWTGSKSRLGRLKSAPFGSPEYAREELVAEIGAAFLCADLDISIEPREDHATYLNGWLKALKDDKRLIVNAAAAAGKACDLLHSLQIQQQEAVA